MKKSALNKWAEQLALGRTVYRGQLGSLLIFLAIGVLMMAGYLTELRDILLSLLFAGVLYEAEGLRGDVQYYGELWFRDLK